MRLTIAKPCAESWLAMSPRPTGRHCAACDRVVTDLTVLPPVAAQRELGRLVARVRAGEHVCVRRYGTVPPSSSGQVAPTRRHRLTNAMATLLAMTAAGSLFSAEVGPPEVASAPTGTTATVDGGCATTGNSDPGTEAPPAGEETTIILDLPICIEMGELCEPSAALPPEPPAPDWH